jgi:beta propeller repeat protein
MGKESVKWHIWVLISLLFLLFSQLIPLGSAQNEGAIPISNNLEHQFEPVIYDNYIVWTDYRNDNGSGLNADVYLYDTNSNSEKALCTDTRKQVRPDIYGRWVVWEDNRAGTNNWDLWGYDLTAGTKFQITRNPSNQNNPAIYGNLLVWEDVGRLGAARHDNDIYVKDITTGLDGNDYSITMADGEQIDADIYGNYIVWTDRRNGNPDIYYYDLSIDSDSDGTPNYRDSDDDGDGIPDLGDVDPDPAEQPLVTNPERQHNPAIYENYVVFQDHRSGNSDIYLFNLKNKTETALITSPEEESLPRIYDTYIVYEKLIDTQREIFYYDFVTQQSTQITYHGSSQEYPDVYGRKLVWVDYRNDQDGRASSAIVDNGDIYMYKIKRRGSVNTPPVLTDLTAVPDSVEAGGEVTIIVQAHDDDNDKLTYRFTTTGGTITEVEDNKATWEAPDSVGNFNISAYASDSEVFSNTMTVSVSVYKNHPPEILNITVDPETVKTDRATTITVSASDPDGDKLVYEYIISKGEITGYDSQFDNKVTWTAPGDEGEYQVIVKVSDYSETLNEKLLTVEEIITVSVIPRTTEAGDDSGFIPGFSFGAFELICITIIFILIKISFRNNAK